MTVVRLGIWEAEQQGVQYMGETAVFSIAPSITGINMLRSTGKRRALTVLEKREICQKRLSQNMQKKSLVTLESSVWIIEWVASEKLRVLD